MCAQKFCLNSKVCYIVEERSINHPNEVSFAWSFDSQSEAETTLLEQIRSSGTDLLYTSYIEVNQS
jgi:hypothetical protein